MAIWMEIHCDRLSSFCASCRNDNPGVLAFSERESIFNALKGLETYAKKKGWKKTRRGWICPNCSTAK